MGEFRFRVPPEWNLDSFHANAIHVLGMDGIPWPCRIATARPIEPDPRSIVSISRNNDSSGRIYILYPFKERGELLICTGTLPLRKNPYDLMTELARGTVSRLRNQLSIWEEGGLEVAQGIHDKVARCTRMLAQAILCQVPEEKDEQSKECIELAMDAIFELSDSFGAQISKFRREHKQLNDFWLAARTDNLEQFEEIGRNQDFELIQYKMSSSDGSEESKFAFYGLNESNQRIVAGPWLDASVGGMPKRITDLEDFPVRKNKIMSELREDLKHLPKNTSLLHVAGGLNGIGHRHLSHPQQLQFTIDLLRVVEDSRVEVPTMISFDFPWAERLSGAVGGVHPLQIADSLLRQGVEISLLGLEINLNYWPNGSAIRDPLQWIDLIDIWAQLGMPIVLLMRSPFGSGPDDAARSADRQVNRVPDNITDQQRLNFLSTVIPVMVARPAVYGLIWSQWNDTDDLRYPHSGLFEGNALKGPMQQLLDVVRKHTKG